MSNATATELRPRSSPPGVSSSPTPAADAKTSEIRALIGARPAPPRPTSVRATPKPSEVTARTEEEEVEELRTMDLTELAAAVRRARTVIPPPLPSTRASAPTLPAPALAESRAADADLDVETLALLAPSRAARALAAVRAALVYVVVTSLFVGYAARAAFEGVRSWLPHVRPLLARAFVCVRGRLAVEWRRAKARGDRRSASVPG